MNNDKIMSDSDFLKVILQSQNPVFNFQTYLVLMKISKFFL